MCVYMHVYYISMYLSLSIYIYSYVCYIIHYYMILYYIIFYYTILYYIVLLDGGDDEVPPASLALGEGQLWSALNGVTAISFRLFDRGTFCVYIHICICIYNEYYHYYYYYYYYCYYYCYPPRLSRSERDRRGRR